MGQTFTIFSLIYLVTSLVAFFGAFLAWQKRDVRGAVDVTILMIASALSSFWLIFESAATTISDKVLFSKLEMTGGIVVPILFFIFVLRFSSLDKHLSNKHIWGYFFIPAVTLIIIFTNELHHLYWSGFSPISPVTNLIEYYHGPLFWIGYVLYSNILLAIATALLIKFIISHKLSFRSHGLILITGSLLPWISSFFYMSGINIVPGLDLVPITMSLSGIILIYSVLYTRFLDLIPVARETLVELMPEGILALDKKNRIQDINSKALYYLGINIRRVTGLQLDGTLTNNPLLTEAVLSEKSPEHVETVTADRPIFYSVVKQSLGSQPGSRLILISDITEHILSRRQVTAAEESYRKLYHMFTLMTDNMPDMLWAKDMQMRYIFANRSVCDNMPGTNKKEDIIGKTISGILKIGMSGEELSADYSSFIINDHNSDLMVLTSGKSLEYKDSWPEEGIMGYLNIRKAPIFNETGEMIGLVASGHDITKENIAEMEVLRRDSLLDSIARATATLIQSDNIVETIPAVLEIIGSSTGSGSVRIYRSHKDNSESENLFSLYSEWTAGQIKRKLDDPNMQNLSFETLIPQWQSILKSGGLISGVRSDFSGEEQKVMDLMGIRTLLASPIFVESNFWGFIVFSNYDEEKRWLTSEVQILSAASNTIGFAIQRKYSRDELVKAKERAEESDRLKSAFLANISHEIRTPMNGILGFTDLLKEPKLSSKDKHQYIEIIEKSGKRMLN
ncbi:MAG: GAF domain-containing protein, partial [Bacteroidales bacterium]|nr:GAF domain-containing protein [Bacteroidales bacterium]